MNQPTLFHTNTIPLGEQVELIERQLKAKCQKYNLTFGIFKTNRGPVDHTSMIVLTDNHGHHFTTSVQADSMHALLSKVNEALQTINKAK